MPSKPLEDLESLIGQTRKTVHDFKIERGKVEEFARAIDDPDPIYRSRKAALDAGYPAVPAPPTFTRVAYFPRHRPDNIGRDLGFDLGFDPKYVIHGSQEYEYDRPLYVGNVLSGETTLVAVYQKEGTRGGTMTFAELETAFYDEDGDRVQIALNTRIETAGAIEGASQ